MAPFMLKTGGLDSIGFLNDGTFNEECSGVINRSICEGIGGSYTGAHGLHDEQCTGIPCRVDIESAPSHCLATSCALVDGEGNSNSLCSKTGIFRPYLLRLKVIHTCFIDDSKLLSSRLPLAPLDFSRHCTEVFRAKMSGN